MKAKISRIQYFFMIPNLLYGKAIGITSGIVVRAVGGDAWISMSIAFLFGTLITMVISFLGNKYPEKTILEYSEIIIGSWFKKYGQGCLYYSLEYPLLYQ